MKSFRFLVGFLDADKSFTSVMRAGCNQVMVGSKPIDLRAGLLSRWNLHTKCFPVGLCRADCGRDVTVGAKGPGEPCS